MIKIDDHCRENLDRLALQHYSNLIQPLNADGITYHARNSLIGRIQARRDLDIINGEDDRTLFWDYLLSDDYVNLKRIIAGRPEELAIMIDEIDDLVTNAIFSINHNYNTATLTAFGQLVKNVFNYENLIRSKPFFNQIYATFNLNYCPYCNENTTPTIEIINDEIEEPQKLIRLNQLDHFYPRCRFPYLSLSFFNLIPVCASCNSAICKGEKDFNIKTHFNPFHKRFDDFFSFKLENYLLASIDEVVIKIDENQAHTRNAVNDFRLETRYNHLHKEVAFNLVNTFKHRNPSILNELKGRFVDLFSNEPELLNLLLKANGVPRCRNHINSLQLAKMKRDICIDMEVLNG